MDLKLEPLLSKYPGRERQIKELNDLFDYAPVPNLTFVHGPSAVGKTSVLIDFFKHLDCTVAYINCIECYTQRLLLEPILSQLLKTSDGICCENFSNFVVQLTIAAKQGYFNGTQIIVLDGVEHLLPINEHYFSTFMYLQELTKIYTLGVIFISNILPEKFNSGSAFVSINFPQYTKDELILILKSHKPSDCNDQFFSNYLSAATSVFLRTTRDLNEILNLVLPNFEKYQEPVVNGELKENDSAQLWRLIVPHLKNSLNTVYLGINSSDESGSRDAALITTKASATFDLPYYAKYILIAAYLASYNSPKHDKRLFLKNHGKKKKRLPKSGAKQKLSVELIGPKSFSLDRLLAIFYSIVEEKASLTVNLLSQLASLVELKLLAKIGDGCIDKPKFKCLIDYPGADAVAKTLAFNIKKYLLD